MLVNQALSLLTLILRTIASKEIWKKRPKKMENRTHKLEPGDVVRFIGGKPHPGELVIKGFTHDYGTKELLVLEPLDAGRDWCFGGNWSASRVELVRKADANKKEMAMG